MTTQTVELHESILQVEADLRQRCKDSSGLGAQDYRGHTSWMLGCATAKLAEANREINRLRRDVARLERER